MMRSVTSTYFCGMGYVLTISTSAKLHLEYRMSMLANLAGFLKISLALYNCKRQRLVRRLYSSRNLSGSIFIMQKKKFKKGISVDFNKREAFQQLVSFFSLVAKILQDLIKISAVPKVLKKMSGSNFQVLASLTSLYNLLLQIPSICR